jgi:CBS-domain-containing membrane protein
MQIEVKACGPNTNVAEAAQLRWANYGRAVPVLDDQGKVSGMITDRLAGQPIGDFRKAHRHAKKPQSREVVPRLAANRGQEYTPRPCL